MREKYLTREEDEEQKTAGTIMLFFFGDDHPHLALSCETDGSWDTMLWVSLFCRAILYLPNTGGSFAVTVSRPDTN